MSGSEAIELVSAVIMLIGAFFALLAGVGLHRFDSVFARMHAAGKSATFGLGFILFGAGLRIVEIGSFAKLGVVGLLGLLTIPAGVHLISRAAWRVGTELNPQTRIDDATRARLEFHRLNPDD
jgi:multicomponent Na+:H+ antiporter subunit G